MFAYFIDPIQRERRFKQKVTRETEKIAYVTLVSHVVSFIFQQITNYKLIRNVKAITCMKF